MKILLAVDGSEHAVRATQKLVETVAAYKQVPEVELITVHLRVPHVGGMAGIITKGMIEEYYRDEGEKALAPSKDVLNAAGVKYSPHVLVGEIAQSVVDHAKKSNCEMIYMGTRGMSAVTSSLLGSIAVKVVHLSRVPVVLVP